MTVSTESLAQTVAAVTFRCESSYDIDDNGGSVSKTAVYVTVDGKETELESFIMSNGLLAEVKDIEGNTSSFGSELCDIVGDEDQMHIETLSKKCKDACDSHLMEFWKLPQGIDWDSHWDHELSGRDNHMPITVLTNGLRVANFCSAHTFEFEDGSILGKRSDAWADRVKADISEHVIEERHGINLIAMSIKTSGAALLELKKLTIKGHDDFDLLIMPLMMCQGLASVKPDLLRAWLGDGCDELMSKVVSIRRVGRGGPICIDKFCVQ